MKKIVEVACGSYEDGLAAYQGGANRIELNTALYLGGLTPSIASLHRLKKEISIPIVCMVRDRGAGFHYSNGEIEVMYENATMLLKHGADGIVFGCLDSEGNIDIDTNRRFVELAHSFQKEAIFHRAFDCVKNPFKAIEALISLEVDRVLTSGLQNKAIEGIVLLKELEKNYGDRIGIVVGSGINETNAKEIMKETNIFQIHSSCKEWIQDPTTSINPRVSYSFGVEDCYDKVGIDVVKKLVESIQ